MPIWLNNTHIILNYPTSMFPELLSLNTIILKSYGISRYRGKEYSACL